MTYATSFLPFMPICDITVSSGELYKHAYKLCYNSRNILFKMRGKIKLVCRFQQTSGYITNYLGNTILSSVLLILRKKMSAILCMPIFNAIQILQKMGFHYRQVFFSRKKMAVTSYEYFCPKSKPAD